MHKGITDDQVLDLANSSNSLLLTEDKDFGELIYRQRRVHCGVILIRLFGLSSNLKAQRTSEALRDQPQAFDGAFTLISPGIMRIRRP